MWIYLPEVDFSFFFLIFNSLYFWDRTQSSVHAKQVVNHWTIFLAPKMEFIMKRWKAVFLFLYSTAETTWNLLKVKELNYVAIMKIFCTDLGY